MDTAPLNALNDLVFKYFFCVYVTSGVLAVVSLNMLEYECCPSIPRKFLSLLGKLTLANFFDLYILIMIQVIVSKKIYLATYPMTPVAAWLLLFAVFYCAVTRIEADITANTPTNRSR